MSFHFPYQYGFVDNRKIPYPIVPVTLGTIRGPRMYSFIMDTGADTMTLPRYMITLLGIKQSALTKSTMQGIGASQVNTWEAIVPIAFCKQNFSIPCSFTEHDKVPFLLGKEEIFNRFTIVFDNDQQRTTFQEKPVTSKT